MPQKNIFDLSGFFSDLTTSNLKVRFFNKAAADVTATQSSDKQCCCKTALRLKTFIFLSNLHTYIFLQVSAAK